MMEEGEIIFYGKEGVQEDSMCVCYNVNSMFVHSSCA